MSVTAGTIILGTAILGAVSGSVGTTMVYENFFGDSKKVVEERSKSKNPSKAYTAHPCMEYDINGNITYYYKKNGCY